MPVIDANNETLQNVIEKIKSELFANLSNNGITIEQLIVEFSNDNLNLEVLLKE